VSVTRIFDFVLERPILFRRYIIADYRGRSDGLHGADTVAPDVAPV